MGSAFEIPDGTRRLFLHLQQAVRQGDARSGAATRFDDIGAFVFPTEAQARALIADWPSPAAVYVEPPATLAAPPDPLSVLRGSRSGELLAPPADPATVTPFVPEWGAVLPAIEGFKLARPCSRRRPDKIMNVWTPDRDVVARFDRELAPLVQGALERSPMPRKPTWSSGSYYRQYVGLVIDNRRIVYANAFLPLVTPRAPTGVSDTWQTQIVNACDRRREVLRRRVRCRIRPGQVPRVQQPALVAAAGPYGTAGPLIRSAARPEDPAAKRDRPGSHRPPPRRE